MPHKCWADAERVNARETEGLRINVAIEATSLGRHNRQNHCTYNLVTNTEITRLSNKTTNKHTLVTWSVSGLTWTAASGSGTRGGPLGKRSG